jgi:hypothetical protein
MLLHVQFGKIYSVIRILDVYPGFGLLIFTLPGSRIRITVLRIRDPVPFWPLDPGWVESQHPDPGWTTRIICSNESLETIFWLKFLNSLKRIRDPGWRQFGSGIREGKKVGSGINKPNPQHWKLTLLFSWFVISLVWLIVVGTVLYWNLCYGSRFDRSPELLL